jgi:hypothetical protein
MHGYGSRIRKTLMRIQIQFCTLMQTPFRIQLSNLMWIRILIQLVFNEIMRPLVCRPSRALNLLNFEFNADLYPDPAFHSNADLYP